MEKKLIGKQIQARREEIGMSQEQLAEAVGLSVKTIAFIEQGRNAPSMESFVKIANALRTSADALLADVLDYGYKVKASRFGERIEQTPHDKQKQIFDVVEAMLK